MCRREMDEKVGGDNVVMGWDVLKVPFVIAYFFLFIH